MEYRSYWVASGMQGEYGDVDPRVEGHVVGDTAGAIDAYTRYLNLRSAPDPELLPEVDSVRTALDGLLKASG